MTTASDSLGAISEGIDLTEATVRKTSQVLGNFRLFPFTTSEEQ